MSVTRDFEDPDTNAPREPGQTETIVTVTVRVKTPFEDMAVRVIRRALGNDSRVDVANMVVDNATPSAALR